MSYNPKTFQVLTESIDKARTGSWRKAVAYLENNVKVVLDRRVMSSPVGSEKKLWEQSHNLVTSFLDGAGTGDVDTKDLKTLASDLRSAEKAHNERLYKVKEAKEKQHAQSGTFEGDYEENPVSPLKYDAGEGATKVFHKYENQRSKVEIDTKKQFVAVRMPLVVITSGIPDPIKLKRTGLCDDLLFGYPVLKNQVLIGLNSVYLREFTPGWSKYQKEVKNNVPVVTKLDVNWDQVMLALGGMLKEKTGRSFVMMGKSAHKYGKLQWIWMAESRELARLNGTTGMATFSVADWSFPFESEMRHVRHNPKVSK